MLDNALTGSLVPGSIISLNSESSAFFTFHPSECFICVLTFSVTRHLSSGLWGESLVSSSCGCVALYTALP